MEQGARALTFFALTLTSWSSARTQQATPVDPPGVVLRLRVVDEAHQPLSGVGLVLGDPAVVTTDDVLQHPQVTSDDQGRIAVAVPDDSSMLRVAVVAAPQRAAWSFPVGPDSIRRRARELGDIVLPRAVTLVGHVCDADGEPLANATVTSNDLMRPDYRIGTNTSRTRTDQRGMFRLRGVFPTAMSLTVSAAGHLGAKVPWVGIGDPIEVRLQRSGVVSGAVQAVEGMPPPTHVMLASEFAPLFGSERQPLQDGRFRLELGEPGRYRVLTADGAGNIIGQSRLLEGPASEVAVPIVEGAIKALRVHAVDDVTNEPVRTFFAASIEGGVVHHLTEERLASDAIAAGDDGQVTSRHKPVNGRIVVYAGADGYATTLLCGATGSEATVRLQRAGRISGRLTGADAHSEWIASCAWSAPLPDSPLPDDHVAPKQAQLAPVAADGAFAFDRLAPGRHTIAVRRRGGTAEARCTVEVATGQRDAITELDLPLSATLSVTVTGAPATARGWRLACSVPQPQDPRRNAPVDDPIVAAFANEQCSAELTADGCQLTGLAASEHLLMLTIPAPPRTGPDLRLKLPAVVVAQAEQALELDLSGFVPGTIDGRVELVGADVAPGRLAVIASPGPTSRAGWGTAYAHWSLVAPDGGFSILVEPGERHLEVVDVATGVTLLDDTATFEVAAGGSTEVALRVELATLHVRFTPPPTDVLWLQDLTVQLGAGDSQQRHGFGRLLFGQMGITYAGRATDLALLVPPGAITLSPRSGPNELALGTAKWSLKPSPTELQVRAGEDRIVTLPLPEPQPISGGD